LTLLTIFADTDLPFKSCRPLLPEIVEYLSLLTYKELVLLRTGEGIPLADIGMLAFGAGVSLGSAVDVSLEIVLRNDEDFLRVINEADSRSFWREFELMALTEAVVRLFGVDWLALAEFTELETSKAREGTRIFQGV
jgi:hypothetical protein